MFRLLRLLRIFRIIHLYLRISYIFSRTSNSLIYIIVLSVLTVSGGAFGIYLAESNIKDTKVTNIGDAFWWALVTVTTVGYGDVYPVTVEGKIIAGILMIAGIAIIGLLISTLGASFVESRLKPKIDSEVESKKKLKDHETTRIQNEIVLRKPF
jgi:voltage-gated potassium channel